MGCSVFQPVALDGDPARYGRQGGGLSAAVDHRTELGLGEARWARSRGRRPRS